tara:strand:+ start:5752 stop:5922 length:171 start_codon:yes stop_codon:yes gene_type:complete
MKLTSKRPLYINGKVVEGEFETNEPHGKELVRKGYAELVEAKAPAKTTRKTKKSAD